MNTQQEFPYMYIGIVGIYGQIKDLNQVKTSGFYKVAGFDSSISNTPSGNGYGTLEAIDTGGYILQRYISRNKEIFVRHNMNDVWYPWQRIDNFGYNTLAELSAGVEKQMFPGMAQNTSGFKSGTLNLVSGVDNSIKLGAGLLFTYSSGAQSFRAFGINYWGSDITTIYADTSSQGFAISKNASSSTIVFTPDRDRTLRYVFIGELFE